MASDLRAETESCDAQCRASRRWQAGSHAAAGAECSRSGGEVLLLKRNSLHNHDKWGLPGGNVDEGDDQALATAEREALEEMGSLPAYTVAGEIHTMCAAPLTSFVFFRMCAQLLLLKESNYPPSYLQAPELNPSFGRSFRYMLFFKNCTHRTLRRSPSRIRLVSDDE